MVVRHSATRPISGWTAIVLGVAVTLIASLVALTLADDDGRATRDTGLPLRPPVVEEPSLSPEPSPSRVGASPSVSVTKPPSPSRTPSRAPSPTAPKITARYVTAQEFDDGQLGTITVKNAGAATSDWTLTLEFVDGSRVNRARVVSGGQDVDADRTDDGVRLSGRITAGSTIVIAISVSRPQRTSSAPRSCVVNGVPCQ